MDFIEIDSLLNELIQAVAHSNILPEPDGFPAQREVTMHCVAREASRLTLIYTEGTSLNVACFIHQGTRWGWDLNFASSGWDVTDMETAKQIATKFLANEE